MADQTETTATEAETGADQTVTETTETTAETGAIDKGAGDKGAGEKGGKGGKTTEAKTTGKDDGGTALDDDGEDKPVTAPANWPADWREKMAGSDKKKLATLKRFTDPAALWASYEAMRQKVSTGELKGTLPADATDEQKAEWRKASGIPESPDKYEIKLDDGLVIGESDKPLVDEYLKVAHGLNQTPDQVSANVAWFLSAQEELRAQIAENNKAAKIACEEELRAEWGGEYRPTLNTINALLDGAPEGVKATIINAKLPDGTALLNNANAMRFFANMAREMNPVGLITGADGAAGTAGIEDRIAEIEKMMRTDRDAYNKDEKVQAELLKLYGAREKLKARAA